MSKEEFERESVQGLSSSVPSRRTSAAPAMLPSTPPSTDDIDTDWGDGVDSDTGFDDSNEVTHVMEQPLRVSFTPRAPSEPPTAPAASNPPQPPTAWTESSPALSTARAFVPPPEATLEPTPEPAQEPESSIPSMRPMAATLIGLTAPVPPSELGADFEASDPEQRDSTPPPMPSAAFSEPVLPPSPPPAVAPPSAPPPIAAPSVPPPSVAAARSSAPPPRSSLPPAAVSPAIAEVAKRPAAQPSGFGRWLMVLAAGLVLVSVLGYRVWSRNRAALAKSAAANALVEQASAAASAATPEPGAAAQASDPAAAGRGTPAAAEGTSAVSLSAATPAAEGTPTAAPAANAPSAEGAIRRVTVKSKPPKVRFFHFGKQVGVTPFVLELKPGERHAYEAALPGYGTRKVVIDGSKPEIVIGLKREGP